MEQEPDYLDIMREELYAEYEQTFLPKVASAKRRKKTMGRFGRDLAVQTLATIIGGVALGGGAVAMGWIGSDPWLGALAVSLVLFSLIFIWTSSRPLYTAKDLELMQKLRAVDDLIADRDRRREATPSDDSQHQQD